MRKTRRLKHGSQRDVALRKQVWKRDRGKCQGPYCRLKPDYSLRGQCFHVDHIIPLSKSGQNTLDNTRLLCLTCHALRRDPNHDGLRRQLIAQKRMPPTGWRHLLW